MAQYSTRIGRILIGALCSVFLVAPAHAGTQGTLSGKVTDIQTGEPLPQANIFVAGSGRGGVTNAKGEYKIENITAGVYTE